MRCLNVLAGLCARCRRDRCWYTTLRRCSQRHDANYTHFGFDYVDEQQKAKKVHGVFSSVASRYDVMNDAMSLGIHRLWKDLLVHRLRPSANCRVLDVAGGTGDVAFRILRSMRIAGRPSSAVDEQEFQLKSELLDDDVVQDQYTARKPPVVVCDINGDMLAEGRRRALLEDIGEDQMSWVEADAETLPFADCTFDAYTIAFGIRNVTHMDRCLSEAFRVLKPGGRFLCLEFSHVENPAFRWIYDQYSFQVIPPLGMLISGDWNSYQYLVESIRRFPAQREFARMIGDVGFRAVTYENVTGGVVAIHSGYKL